MNTPAKPLSGLHLVGYVRVSTDAQLDGLGLDVQEEGIRSFGKRNGAKLLQVCSDEGVTGTDTLDREGLACALEAIAAGDADGLLIPSLSRLARRLDVQEAVLALVWSYGGRVFSVDEGEITPDDADDPMRSFARKLYGLIHELDAATIARRLRKGRQAKAARGGYAGGRPAYGQQAVDKELAPVSGEQAVVERVREMRDGGASWRTIADTLNGEDVPTKAGGRWHPTSVRRLVDPASRVADSAAGRRRRERLAHEKQERQNARAAAAAGLVIQR